LKYVKSILLLFLAITGGFGQVDQLERYEIALGDKDENDPYQVTSLAEDGVLIYRRVFGKGQEDMLELIKIDTTLKENWRGYISTQKILRVSHVKSKDNLVFILLKAGFTVSGDFQVIAVNIQDGTYSVYTIKNLIPFNPTDFVVTHQGVMIGGYFNYRPLVLFYSFRTQRAKILPGFYNERGELNQIKTNDNGTVDVIVSANNFERKKCLWIRNYNEEGDLVKTTVLEPEINKNLIFGRSVKRQNDEQVVAGVYGSKNAEYSRGIFVAEINPVGEYSINYYNFGDLQNFFSYMKAKRERRVKDRIERRKVKGKRIRFNYRFLVHEVVPYGDQYVMLGEAFYPRYTYISGRGYGLLRDERIFDGYQYTHAVVIGFDSQGKLKWDNSFEINDVKTMELQQFVKLSPTDSRIVLLYVYDNLIRSKIIKDNQVVEGKTENVIKSGYKKVTLKENDIERSKLDYWYTEHFFASGIQLVKIPVSPKDAVYRRVFFINKLKYQ
jgi:hypothetical protein